MPPATPTFRNRSHEVSRLEAFSDAALGFALTLLVVSLEVPSTAHELFDKLKSAPVFAVCFAVLLNLWWDHHRYFRRYGLNDLTVFILNSILLFLVLLYIYPLKFLLTAFINGGQREDLTAWQIRGLYILYSGGYAAVALTFATLYAHAWRRRASLDLDAVEEIMTREAIALEIGKASVCLLSTSIALFVPIHRIAWAGWVLFLFPVPLTIIGMAYGRRAKLAAAQLATQPTPPGPR